MATLTPILVSHHRYSVYLSGFANLVTFFFIPLSSAMVEMFLGMFMKI